MKNHIIGDTVKVTKAGIFNGSIGRVISIKYEVDFGAIGKWQFDSKDILANMAQISPMKELSDENDKVVSQKEKSLLKTVKSPKIVKVKKVKAEQTKEKRKYTKRIAT
jgi:hypothetical protein